MKPLYIALLVLAILCPNAFCLDVVKMKNGDVYRGEIIEQEFNKFIQIRFKDGNEKNLPWKQIKTVSKEQEVTQAPPTVSPTTPPPYANAEPVSVGPSEFAKPKESDAALGNSIDMLRYFVPRNHLFLDMGAKFSLSDKVKIKNSTTNVIDGSVSAISIPIELTYGFSETFSLTLAIEELLKHNTETTILSPRSVSTTKQYGLSDPKLIANFRVPVGSSDGLVGNIKIGVSPPVMKAKTGTTTESGTNGRGGTEISLEADIIGGSRAHEWAFGTKTTLTTTSTVEANPSTSGYELETYVETLLGLIYRLHPSDEAFISATVGLDIVGNRLYKFKTATIFQDGIKSFVAPAFILGTGFRFGKSVLLQMSLTYLSYTADEDIVLGSSSAILTDDASKTYLAVGFSFEL